MTIYSPSGVALIDAPILKTAKVQNALRSDFCVKLQFNSGEFYNFTKGTYILYKGCKFEIRDMATPESLPDAAGYKYDLTFYGQASRMKDRCIFWLKGTNREATFQDTTTLRQFAQLIAENMNAFLGVTTWCVGIIPENKEEVMQAVQFDGTKCWDGLYNIADIFGVEAWVNDEIDRVTINFGKLEHGEAITIREGEIVRSIPAKRGYVEGYGNRFYVFGGTKNIPANYYESADGEVTNHVSAKRLHLPDGYDYIDAFEGLAQPFIIEQVVNLDDVFPQNELTITEVNEREVSTDGLKSKIYTIKCSNQIPVKVVETLGLKFTSGGLEGREFGLTRKDDNAFEIVQQSESVGESSIIIPNDYLRPVVGDTFILTGVELPPQNISIAEETLLQRGQEWAMEHSSDTDVYSCPTNISHCMRNRINLELGQRVTLMLHSYGDSGRSSRIQGYEKSLLNEYDATYEIGDNSRYTAKGRLSKLESKIYKVATDLRVQYDKGSSATNKIGQLTAERDEAFQEWKKEQEEESGHQSVSGYQSEYEQLAAEYASYLAQYPVGSVMFKELADYTLAWSKYEPELVSIINSGVKRPVPSEAFKAARDAFYAARASLTAYLAKQSKANAEAIDKVASRRAEYINERERIIAEMQSEDEEFVATKAKFLQLADSEGKVLTDRDGKVLVVRAADTAYDAYRDAGVQYIIELDTIIATSGDVTESAALGLARTTYYRQLGILNGEIAVVRSEYYKVSNELKVEVQGDGADNIGLKDRMKEAENGLTSQGERISIAENTVNDLVGLTNGLKAEVWGVTGKEGLTDRIAAAEGGLTSQGERISGLETRAKTERRTSVLTANKAWSGCRKPESIAYEREIIEAEQTDIYNAYPAQTTIYISYYTSFNLYRGALLALENSDGDVCPSSDFFDKQDAFYSDRAAVLLEMLARE